MINKATSSTLLSMKVIMLIHIKMQTTFVCILIFISTIYTASESLKARKVYFPAFEI